MRSVCRQLGINSHAPMGECERWGALLKDLSPQLDPARARYLEAALVDPRSLNLRNRAAHELGPETPRYQFVVLFHITCLLTCVSHLGVERHVDGQRPCPLKRQHRAVTKPPCCRYGPTRSARSEPHQQRSDLR